MTLHGHKSSYGDLKKIENAKISWFELYVEAEPYNEFVATTQDAKFLSLSMKQKVIYYAKHTFGYDTLGYK